MSPRLLPAEPDELSSPLGRYSIHQAIAVGEVTSVHIGLLEGAEGFRKTVAIKRLIAGLVHEPAALAELTYEACVGALVHHPNVVSVIDLGQVENGPFLVMEYVLGETVAGLLRASGRCPVPIAVAIIADTLRGLDAAHVAEDAAGAPIEIVHRNVSPENILVGVDGLARVIDFGSSVSALDSLTIPNRQRWTRRASITSPEQLMGWPVDGQADVFAAAVVLWELVAGMRPFRNQGAHQAFLSRPTRKIPPASAFNMEVSPEFDAVMEQALSWSPRRRFESAAHFAEELEAAVAPSSRTEVMAFVESMAATRLAVQRKLLGAMDAPYGRISTPPPPARRIELDRAVPFARQKPTASSVSPPTRSLAVRFAELQKAITSAIGRAPWANAPRSQIAALLSRLALRSKKATMQRGSTVLASLSLLCLLLAATRGSIGDQGREHAAGSPNEAAALPVANLRLDDECPPVVAAQHADDHPANARPAARPAAQPAATLPAMQLAPAHTAPAPERAPRAIDERERSGGRPPPRRNAPSPAGDRASCEPPFVIDEAGIRRIKSNCFLQ
jgi:eukaryotic-like serine/threonine-protein kinase